MRIQVNLKEVLKERNMTQKDLAEISGLAESQISNIASNRTNSINKEHVANIIKVLKIKDLNTLFSVVE